MADTLSRAGNIRKKDLLSHWGFLVYSTMTYRVLNSHLKEFHLTVGTWIPHKDSKGRKLQGKKCWGLCEMAKYSTGRRNQDHNLWRQSCIRKETYQLWSNSRAKKKLRKILTRVREQAAEWYLLRDASYSGFVTGLFAKGHLMFESEDWASYEQENNFNWG